MNVRSQLVSRTSSIYASSFGLRMLKLKLIFILFSYVKNWPNVSESFRSWWFLFLSRVPPHFLNLHVNFRIYNSPPPFPVLCQINSPNALPCFVFFVQCYPHMYVRTSMWYLSFRFPHQNSMRTSLITHTSHMLLKSENLIPCLVMLNLFSDFFLFYKNDFVKLFVKFGIVILLGYQQNLFVFPEVFYNGVER